MKRGASPTSSLTSSLSSSKLKENSNSFSMVKPSNHLLDDDKELPAYERGRVNGGVTGKNVLFASSVENSLSSLSISEHLGSNSSYQNSITPTTSRYVINSNRQYAHTANSYSALNYLLCSKQHVSVDQADAVTACTASFVHPATVIQYANQLRRP